MTAADLSANGTAIHTSTEREAARARAVRDGVRRDPVLRGAAFASAAWVAAYAAASMITTGHPTWAHALSNVVYLVPVALATALSVAAARSAATRQRTFWTLLACSNLLWLAGESTWAWYVYVLDREPPFPSAADVFYLTSYLLVLPAIAVGYRGTRPVRVLRAGLDASVIVVALGVGGYTLLIHPQLTDGFSLAAATGIAYPLLGVAILMLLGLLAFNSHQQVPIAIVLVALAFGVSALTDIGYTYLTALHEYVPVWCLSVGWQAEAVLLCLGALVAVRTREHDPAAVTLPRDSGLPLILAGLAITVLVIAVGSRDGRISAPNALLGSYAIAAVVVRLWLTAVENRHIAGRLAHALSEQERLAVTDGLTGLHNRRFFDELLRMEADRARRSRQPIGLLVLDVDHFKRVNDRHGHQGGDHILRELAVRLATTARASDVLARYGGEEFVLLLPGTDADHLDEIAEQCRRAVSERPFHLPSGARLGLTISIGGAALTADDISPDDLVRAADHALYAAKAGGRDRCVYADVPLESLPTPVSR